MKRGRRALQLTLGVASAVLAYAWLIEPNFPRAVPKTLSCRGLISGSVRILLISDLDFVVETRRERAIADAAGRFRPDIVMIAGDFLDRRSTASDRSVLEKARRFLSVLPAPYGRFLAPGEEESSEIESVRAAFGADTVQVLSNEARMVDVRGERIDLFVADPRNEPAPWWIGEDGHRSFLESRGRYATQYLLYGAPESEDWTDVEATFAFQIMSRDAVLDFRIAWTPTEHARGGVGWRLLRHGDRPDFRAYAYSAGWDSLEGRRFSGFSPPLRVWCRARVSVRDEAGVSRLRARFWVETQAEPTNWQVDVADRSANRHTRGTVGFGGRAGRRRYSDLMVTTPEGRVLLAEPFDDTARMRTRWRSSESHLTRWLTADSHGGARVLLAHNPDLVFDVAAVGGTPPDLMLAGHTHGGQVRIPGFGALYTATELGPSFDAGLFRFLGVPIYITPGVGTSLFPLRLFSPPEVSLLTLVPPTDTD